jgi:fructokinase
MKSSKLLGGIEAGGTKFVCAVGSGPQDILSKVSFPTTIPVDTLAQVARFFRKEQEEYGPLSAIGVASFGPVDPLPGSSTYGYITTTPKAGWASFDFVGALQEHFSIPVGFDTDVNGAALGEWRWGAAQGLDTFIYMTIGTGIGGGGLVNGRLMHGLIHPEMGHIRLPHDWQVDPFPGICPYHGDCLEGIASGPAMEKRWGRRGEALQFDHPAWDLEAHYLALGLVNVICTLSPQRIVMGGGVMSQAQLFPLLRSKVQALLNRYVQAPQILEDIEHYIVPPGLGAQAGVLGAIALAYSALE